MLFRYSCRDYMMVQMSILSERESHLCGHTVIAKEAHRFLGLKRNEGSNEVVADGCDEDNEQEDLGLK